MKLNSTELGKVFLAPLSGVADSPFRRICKRLGAETVYSEMVSCEGLTRQNRLSFEILRFHEEEHPIGIQIFGNDPGRMAEAARIVEATHADFIDLNMACPTRKIVAHGAGCALMLQPETARAIAKAVVRATSLPVTAKLRLGWDEDNINVIEFARMLEDVGIKALGIHGRTRKQGFKGRAAWERIAEVKANVSIPVILSGDVREASDVASAFEKTGCDAVMVARGVYGRPWIFRAIHRHLEGKPFNEPAPEQIYKIILDHLDMAIEHYGQSLAAIRFRKHLLWYTRAMPGVVALRPMMSRVRTRTDVVSLLEKIFGKNLSDVRDL